MFISDQSLLDLSLPFCVDLFDLFRAKDDGFVVVARIDGQTWSRQQAGDFYTEHREKPFFDSLVEFMISGPVVQLCLEKARVV